MKADILDESFSTGGEYELECVIELYGQYDEENSPQVQVNMTDGTTQEIQFSTSFSQDEKTTLKYLSSVPLDSTMVELVNINGNHIKLD